MDVSLITTTLRRVVGDFEYLSYGRYISSDLCEGSLLSLELVCREFIIAEQLEGLSNTERAALNYINDAITLLSNIKDLPLVERYSPPVIMCSGIVGRSRFEIPRQQLFF